MHFVRCLEFVKMFGDKSGKIEESGLSHPCNKNRLVFNVLL